MNNSAKAQVSTLSETDLLGSWQCEAILHASLYEADADRFTTGWVPNADSLTVSLKNVQLDFQNNETSYSLNTGSPNPFISSSEQPIVSPYRVVAGQLVFRYLQGSANYFYEIRSLDSSRLELVPQTGTTFPTLICTRERDAVATTSSQVTVQTNGKSKK